MQENSPLENLIIICLTDQSKQFENKMRWLLLGIQNRTSVTFFMPYDYENFLGRFGHYERVFLQRFFVICRGIPVEEWEGTDALFFSSSHNFCKKPGS
jgi:hypothetical protein